MRKLAVMMLVFGMLLAADFDFLDFAKVQSGMSEGEILTRLGKPDMVSGSFESDVSRWYWYEDSARGKSIYMIEFWNGRVANKEKVYR